MKEKNKTYTAAEIARYQAGTMPAGEMHALEKAALEDPFLADALEGYVHATVAEDDIEELKARLAEKIKKKNIFFLSSFTHNKWWRIAALFILVTGAGYFFYKVNYNDKEISLAKNDIKAPEERERSIPLVKNDTEIINNEVARPQQEVMSEQKEKSFLPSSKSPAEREGIVRLQKTKPPTVDVPDSKSENSSYADSVYLKETKKEYKENIEKEYVLKGAVIDEMGTPVPYATIKNKTGNTQTVADESGLFVLKSHDSSITAMASAAGYAPKSFNLKKDIQPTIEIKREASSTEVVVTSVGIRRQSKKTASASKILNRRVAGVNAEPARPQPSGGLDKFDQYLKENIPPVYDANGERLNGEVLLSFTINKKGKPQNIKVVKSSCTACEEEAIKLLQNGPGWIGKKNEQATAVIQFNK